MRIKSRTLVLKGGAGGNVAGCWEGGGWYVTKHITIVLTRWVTQPWYWRHLHNVTQRHSYRQRGAGRRVSHSSPPPRQSMSKAPTLPCSLHIPSTIAPGVTIRARVVYSSVFAFRSPVNGRWTVRPQYKISAATAEVKTERCRPNRRRDDNIKTDVGFVAVNRMHWKKLCCIWLIFWKSSVRVSVWKRTIFSKVYPSSPPGKFWDSTV